MKLSGTPIHWNTLNKNRKIGLTNSSWKVLSQYICHLLIQFSDTIFLEQQAFASRVKAHKVDHFWRDLKFLMSQFYSNHLHTIPRCIILVLQWQLEITTTILLYTT